MKILHYINNLGSGGAEKLLTDILPALKNKSHEVELLIVNSNANIKKYEQALSDYNISITSLGVSLYNPLQIIKLVKIINNGKYDIVHAHIFPSQYWLAFASFFLNKKTKLVKTEHSVHNKRRNNKVFKILEKFVYKRYNRIIAITQEVNESIQRWIGKTVKVETVYSGVNLKQIEKEKNLIVDIDFSNAINLLMVARFDFKAKDHLTLIKAFSILPENFILYLAGEGPNQINVKNEVNRLGLSERVIFLGMRPDVYALMSKVDLNILSTNYEGLSGVTLESLASGKPFIGSNVSGVKNVVPNSSFLFPPKSPEILAQKIVEVIYDSELSKKMVDLSLEFVKKFDQEVMVESYIRIYKEVCKI